MTQSFTHPRFRSHTPVEVVSFDCDATLSQIEGIDWVAELVGHGPAVEAMTRVAMQETGINDSLYKDRLELVRPTKANMDQLVSAYKRNLTADADAVIRCLQSLDKTVCVLSAGLDQAVVPFAESLGVRTEHAQAVPLVFTESGEYAGYEKNSNFVRMDGKARWLSEHFGDKHCVHIGDGLNDVSVTTVGVRFVGFGGGEQHHRVSKHASEYIVTNSLAPFLSLILTPEEINRLSDENKSVVEKGDQIIRDQGVLFESAYGRGVC